MFNSLDECRTAWENAGKHGTKAERIARNARWIQYYQNMASGQLDAEVSLDPHAEEVMAFLTREEIIDDVSSVFDIGSGTGGYVLSLAKHCAAVTALDMDNTSLSVLKTHAAQLQLSNVACVHSMWENYNADNRFSVLFSSMCPAICDYNELLKMESMATDACCLIAVSRGSYDLHRKHLMSLLNVKSKGGMTTEAIWYYEMLYLMGRQPSVKTWNLHYEYDLPVEEVCRRNETYFEIFGIPAEDSRPVLRRYFEEKVVDGFVHDESYLNKALIYWRTP